MSCGRALSARVSCLLLCGSAVTFVPPAAAQPREPRYSVWVSAAAQAAAPSLREQFEFLRPVDQAERAIVDADYRSKAGLLIDGGVAVRIRRSLGVGVSVSRFSGHAGADVVAQIPYPFEFGRFREVSGNWPGLDRTELAYHVQLRYSRPFAQRVRLVISGGPTVFDVRREVLSDVQVDEAYPFDTATFRSASARAAKGTGVGFHAGADLAWVFARQLGIGAFARYARGTADLKGPSRTVSVDTGGIQSGVGLRLYF